VERLKTEAAKLGLALNQQQLEQFEFYYRELVDWNRRVNLTAVVDYEEVQLRHFLDSLSILALERDADMPVSLAAARIIDVGTGAGLPGLPLKIACPSLHLTLLESVGKKTSFLEHVVGRLGLEGVEVVRARAEELAHNPHYREAFDLALSRAVASLSVLAELTLPFCRRGGALVAQKKGALAAEVAAAARALSLLGGKLAGVKRLDLEGLEGERCLVVIRKLDATPPVYPRRPGLPARRPL
jgi:16S rRNA (guanine527-N7)-methyltransferase